MPTTVAAIVQDWLDKTGNTAGDLARMCDLPRSTVYNLLRRPESRTREETITALAKVVGHEREMREAAGPPPDSFQGNKLAVIVQQRLAHLGLTYRDVEVLTARRGARVDRGTLSKIVNSQVKRVSDRTIEALAGALSDRGLPKAELLRQLTQARNELRMSSHAQYEIPAKAAELEPQLFDEWLRHLDYLLGVQRKMRDQGR